MKRTVLFALVGALALWALTAWALEINSLRPVGGTIAAGGADSAVYTVAASDPGSLPSGLIVYSGAGDEFWKRNWVFLGDSVWAYETVPHGVPGSFTLPRPPAERRGDSLYVKIELNCPTDTLTYEWTW